MATKKAAGRGRKVGFAFLLIFAPAFLLIFIATRSCEHRFQKLPDFGEVTKYTFTDISGKERSWKDFEGEIVLITTIQPTCPNDCAVSLSNLKLQIYKILKGKRGIRMISFVTDKNGDPVQDLTATEKMLKDQVLDYDPEVWILAKGDPRSIYDIRKGNRKLLDEMEKEGMGEEGYQSLMLLLDRSNHLRMIRSGREEGMVRQMKQHMALLKKEYDVKEYNETH
jgi:cytochrome oxidase Cu insertion factor (SCO1/SenC/PrrC family)